MHNQQFSFLAIITTLTFLHVGTARDLRNVTEPKIPQTCTSLEASGKDDTKLIQNALDSCTKGKAVALTSGIFYSGPLTIPSGVNLLVESGVILRAITDPKLFDLGGKLCGKIDDLGLGCKPFITMHGAKGSGIYGKGTIDGQGDTIVPSLNMSWYHLSHNALQLHKYQNNPRLIQINNSVDITIYQITLMNSPFYHLTASETNGFTVWGITVNTSRSRNTDGIDPVGCQNVTIAYCNISTGDDDIGLKALTAPGRYMSVLNNYINRGDGMAIGSETNYGVSDTLISGLTISNTAVGIYIKSNIIRGGRVSNIVFENICIEHTDHPITLDPEYYYNMQGNNTPVFQNITLRNVRVLKRGTITIHGISQTNPIELTLDNVHVRKGSTFSVSNATIKGTWQEDDNIPIPCGIYGNKM